MRIVIETDQPDEGQSSTRAARAQRQAVVLDGGPAPAALLRRFGRIPQDQAETAGGGAGPAEAAQTQAVTAGPAREAESEGGEVNLNPLRYGAAVATQRRERGGREGTHNEGGEDPGVEAAEGPTAQ